jgi:hypothetical protein
MSCGCKGNNPPPPPNPQPVPPMSGGRSANVNNSKTIQESIKKVVKKYYKK